MLWVWRFINTSQQLHIGLDMKTFLASGVCEQKKSADQPAHLRSLLSAFVIRLLGSIISRPPTSDFLGSLCSWADWVASHLVGNPKTGFLASRPILSFLMEKEEMKYRSLIGTLCIQIVLRLSQVRNYLWYLPGHNIFKFQHFIAYNLWPGQTQFSSFVLWMKTVSAFLAFWYWWR